MKSIRQQRWECLYDKETTSAPHNQVLVYMPDAPEDERDVICKIDNTDISAAERSEIGHLIAAAPDALKALYEVTSAIEAYCHDHGTDNPTDVTVLLPMLRNVIAKANGGSTHG